ncbi:MAG: oxidoreductase [Bacteroidales bacterium]|jgi:predicted dehydrogenase
MAKTLQVGIIGFGLSGKVFHAPFIHCDPNFTLRKIISKRKDEIASVYPYVETGVDPDELFNDEKIDLVIVATPNTSHFDLARKALISGKHVIVEKPVTNSSAEAEELIKLARHEKKVLSVFHNRRWDGDFRTIKKILENKWLGRIVEFESRFDRYRPEFEPDKWRNQEAPGSGVLFDLGPHLIDQAVCLFGRPVSVWADIRNQRKAGKTDDSFEVHLEYGDLRAILKAGVLVREQSQRFVLHGTEGSFVKYGLDPQEEILSKGVMPDADDWGADKAENFGTLNTSVNGMHFIGRIETLPGNYAGYFNNVYRAICHKEDLDVRPEDAGLVIEIIEAAFRSSHEKRVVAF